MDWAMLGANFLESVVNAVIPTVAVAIAGWIGTQIAKRTGVEVEEGHKTAISSALQRGAEYALQKAIGGTISQRVALEYVKRSAPDAIKHFKANDARLAEMLEPRLADVVRKATATQ